MKLTDEDLREIVKAATYEYMRQCPREPSEIASYYRELYSALAAL
jgi:hypothetical protein